MTKSRANATAEAAKGDLRAGSGTNTTTILPVGTDGTTLVANSSAATGLSYQPLNSAGKNAVINGGMDIWQRGISFSFAASTAYTAGYIADRWQTTTGANQATTISRQATADTTNLPNIQYCLRFQRNSGQTGISAYSLVQNFESVNAIPFAGKTITMSFYARAGANYSATSNTLQAQLYTGTGTDQNIFAGYAGSGQVINSPATLTTTWQRFSYSVALASTMTEFAPVFLYTPVGTAGVSDYYEVTGVQVELGSVATNFSRAAGTIQQELAACQRYCYQVAGTGSSFATIGTGYTQSTTIGSIYSFLPVTMRTQPTISYNNIRFVTAPGTVTSFSTTGVTIATGSTPTTINLAATLTAATANLPAYLDVTNVTTSYFQFSAEL